MAKTATFGPAIPIFRIFDVAKAREFYLDFLGMTLDWEHRFEDDLPLYSQVTRGALVLHLSEHAGDASPAARVFVWTRDVRGFQQELAAKAYAYMRPGLEQREWGLEMTVTDPFGNRLTFCEE